MNPSCVLHLKALLRDGMFEDSVLEPIMFHFLRASPEIQEYYSPNDQWTMDDSVRRYWKISNQPYKRGKMILRHNKVFYQYSLQKTTFSFFFFLHQLCDFAEGSVHLPVTRDWQHDRMYNINGADPQISCNVSYLHTSFGLCMERK